MSLDPLRVKRLFLAALDRHDAADRAAFLDAECGPDAELRARVDALLAALDRPDADLGLTPGTKLGDGPDLDATAADFALGATGAVPSGPTLGSSEVAAPPEGPRRPQPSSAALIGTTIAGRFQVVEVIGEGGMGTVYRAEQVAPVRRPVALKLIRAGMDSRTVLARFESERQALAIMDHPHIARVLDAGTTDSGHPFFVMELVRGVPLTEYCDARRLGLPARLQLFRQVCSAVQHAHQKGVIHRDLKPTNILVEDHDGTPVPKVIDFGLAKATTGLPLTEQTLFTAFGAIAGTPLYMAPEQATFNALDVDTRADIYALGVILYELLTGSTPIRKEALQKAAVDEMLRLIREDEPQIPSSRISTSDALPSLAAVRLVEPARLGRFLRGDLDWIVMKALAKERARRYDSAIGLANDVERFLNDEPVTAGPPTARYRAAKFVRRHRGQVVAAGLLLLALLGGVIGTSFGLREARRQADAAGRSALRAEAEAAAREQARHAEAEQRRAAERRLAQNAKISEVLASIFRNLDPRNDKKDGQPIAARLAEQLNQAAAAIDEESIGDPLAVARLQLTLGIALDGLGHAERAAQLLAKARDTFGRIEGEAHLDTLASMSALANAYRAGHPDWAVSLHERVLARRRAQLGDDHPDTLASMSDLADAYKATGRTDKAIPLLKHTLASLRVKLGDDHPDTLTSMNNLGIAHHAAGHPDQAIPLLDQAMAGRRTRLGDDHLDTLRSVCNLAIARQAAGRTDRAVAQQVADQLDEVIPALDRALAVLRAKLDDDHPDTLNAMGALAGAHLAADKPDQAIPLLDRALATRKAKLGDDHPDTLGSMKELAGAHVADGHPDRAIPLLERALAATIVQLGSAHPETQYSRGALIAASKAAGRPDVIVAVHEQNYAELKARLGDDHPDTVNSMNALIAAHQAAGQTDLAISASERSLAARRARRGDDDPEIIVAANNLAVLHLAAGHPSRAVALLDQALAAARTKLGDDHPLVLPLKSNLAAARQATGHPGRAIALLDRALAAARAKLGDDHPLVLMIMNELVAAGQVNGQPGGHLDLARLIVAASRRSPQVDPLTHASHLASLGAAELAQARWGDAEATERECLAIRAAGQPDDWRTFSTKSALGEALLGQKRYDKARPLLEDGYRGLKRRAGQIPHEGKARLVEALDRLIELAEATGQTDEARARREERGQLAAGATPAPPLARASRALALLRAWAGGPGARLVAEALVAPGGGHPLRHALRLAAAARVVPAQAVPPDGPPAERRPAPSPRQPKRGDEAVAAREAQLRAIIAKSGPLAPATFAARDALLHELYIRSRHLESIPIRLDTLRARAAALGPNDPQTLMNLRSLAGDYRSAGQVQEATALFEHALHRCLTKLPPGHEVTRQILSDTQVTRSMLRDVERAVAISQEKAARGGQAPAPPNADRLAERGLILLKQGRWAEAESDLRQCLALRERDAAAHWTTSQARSMLGEALLGQGDFKEAAPLLLAGFQGLKRCIGQIPPEAADQPAEAVGRLIRLADATSNAADSASWLAEKVRLSIVPDPLADPAPTGPVPPVAAQP